MTPTALSIIEQALSGHPITSEEAEEAMEAVEELRERPSLRDRFAMAALTGRLASDVRGRAMDHRTFSTAATHAYGLADAMLRERAKPIDSQFAEVEP
jgi:hypothetical protein